MALGFHNLTPKPCSSDPREPTMMCVITMSIVIITMTSVITPSFRLLLLSLVLVVVVVVL